MFLTKSSTFRLDIPDLIRVPRVKCNELTTKIKNLANGDEKSKAETELRQREVLKKFHLKQAETFYSRKKLCRENAKETKTCQFYVWISREILTFPTSQQMTHIIEESWRTTCLTFMR